MKKIITSLLIILLVTTVSFAQNGKKYGEKLTLKTKTTISELLKNPDKYDGKTVLVEGVIVNVCEKRGCWIDISSDKEFEKLRFKVEDGVIVFPMEEKGKNIVAEGIFEKQVFTKEQLIEQAKHQAEEYKTKFDPSSIKEGKTTYRLKGLGAVVK
jgi:cytochrome c-type biogenesis protein CcmE